MIAALSVGATTLAGPVGVTRQTPDQQAQLAELEQTRAQVIHERQLPSTRGPLLIHDMTREQQLDRLIARLRNNQPVAPEEIEQAKQP